LPSTDSAPAGCNFVSAPSRRTRLRVKSARRCSCASRVGAKRASQTYIDRQPVPVAWEGSYVIFSKVAEAQLLTATYPLAIQEVREKVQAWIMSSDGRGTASWTFSPPGNGSSVSRPDLERVKCRAEVKPYEGNGRHETRGVIAMGSEFLAVGLHSWRRMGRIDYGFQRR